MPRVAAGLMRMETSRRVKNLPDIAQGLTASGRAHALVLPRPGDEGKAALLGRSTGRGTRTALSSR